MRIRAVGLTCSVGVAHAGLHQPDNHTLVMPIADLIDVNRLCSAAPLVMRRNMTTVLRQAEVDGLTVSGPTGSDVLTSDLMGDSVDVMYRVTKVWQDDYWFRSCEKDAEDPNTANVSTLRGIVGANMKASKKLVNISAAIQEQLGDYDSLHVRRGDKLGDEERYPGLDNCAFLPSCVT